MTAGLRRVAATRYVEPIRSGSSVPVLVEADDLGTYVVKLRAAAQGARALVAEIVAGELARAVGLRVPELVLVDVPLALAASELDPELRQPLAASAGLNLGLDYLPGSVGVRADRGPFPDAATASRVVLFDAFVANVDRGPKNPNLLAWHSRVWLIDHGSALYFHHGWGPSVRLAGARDPFPEVKGHVLLRHASELHGAQRELETRLTRELLERVLGQVPAELLVEGFSSPDEARSAYVEWLDARRLALPALAEEARVARGG